MLFVSDKSVFVSTFPGSVKNKRGPDTCPCVCVLELQPVEDCRNE